MENQSINFEDTAMPFNTTQLNTGANYALNTYQKEDPVDQVNTEHTTLSWLLAQKIAVLFGNGFFREPVYVSNDSNYQNYFGADQVTYNERDPARWTQFQYYNYHDGFWFDEDRLAANGIILTDDAQAVPTGAEKFQLLDLLKTSYTTLKNGIQANLALELLQDGSASTKACPGLDHLVATDPTTGIVGGLDSSTATYWRNNVNLAINPATAAGTLLAAMETTWRDCMRYGMQKPTKIICGSAFLDAYAKDVRNQPGTTLMVTTPAKGGATLDGARSGVFFKGVEVEWDPDFDALDDLLGAITYPWAKRCYFLNDKGGLILRPMKGHWMVNRKPERLPDRYVHYFGQTSKYGMTTNKRNSLAVLSIA
jgi:hypothetical protein